MSNLSSKQCVPCQGGAPPLSEQKKDEFIKELNSDWEFSYNRTRLFRRVKFHDFEQPMSIATKIAKVAQDQWHHPDLKIGFGYLEIEIWTHKINSLVESDFIFASKVDVILNES